ncbi:MAG: 2Fe-2S ferredoxin [Hirschia sp.]|nr:2Fe-2S ferredoxin [Hirschia sp.]MBB37309.1 2Fe-2S ferredoxin [Hirschia sp.]MBF17655.1 2Fe-2S ferredoxin [Hirschia sp.]|tara:strand:- start:447 stop:767 length:321 start_codon:yes stop_codon:yes gene_type:complete
MTKITFVEHDGTEHVVDAANGGSVMEAAINNNVPGIDADCGGACACATCHVYIDAAFTETVGKPNDMEQSMLDFAEGVADNSRLSCQITISDALEGMKVTMPESQS